MAFRSLFWALKWGIITAITVWMIQYWITSKSYIFSPDDVAAIAKKYVGPKLKIDAAYGKIHAELEKHYPGHIVPAKDLQWVFVNMGGKMCSMCVVHASFTEYVLFIGVAMDTSGHSGRHWVNLTSTLISGSVVLWPEGKTSSVLYKSGDSISLTAGEAAGVRLSDGTWTVEYGRGFTPASTAFMLADTAFSTHDFLSAFYLLRNVGCAMWLEIREYVWYSQQVVTDFIKEQLL